MSWASRKEVRCFGRARVIVGQLGAGLFNAGFAPPGCRVIEIATHNYGLNDVWFLCGVLGHRFSRIMAHGGTEDEFAVTPFTFALPLAPALALIDDVLNRL
jgi:capsular polysaccharide biosynthesis protein